MADFFAQYEMTRHTAAWGGFRTGWWFGFTGNIPGAGVATVYGATETQRIEAISNCSPIFSINTKDTNFATAASFYWPGTAFEEFGIEFAPRLHRQGIALSEDNIASWEYLYCSRDFIQAGIASDGELYVCGIEMLRYIDPQYVCIPVPETVDSADEPIPAGTAPSRISSFSLNAGSNQFFRITTEGFGTKWQYAQAMREYPYPLSCCIALDVDGKLYVVGESDLSTTGKLGLGTASTAVSTLTRIGTNTYSQFSMGRTHVLAVRTDGMLEAWGRTDLSLGAFSPAGVRESPLVQVRANPIEISGIVRESTITLGGSGYTSDPSVTFLGASDYTAVATAIRNTSDGSIQKLKITEGGRGYTTAPSITIAPPGGTGVQAQATCSISTAFTQCFAGQLWSLAIDSEGHALAAGNPNGVDSWTAGKISDFSGRYTFRPIPSTVTFTKCEGGEHGQDVAYLFDSSANAYGVGRNDKGQLATGYTSTVENEVVACGTAHSWITMKTVGLGAGSPRQFGIASDGQLYAWGMTTSVNSQNVLNLTNAAGTTAEYVSTPLRAGPQDDRWKYLHGSNGRVLFIRDDDASPDVDYA